MKPSVPYFMFNGNCREALEFYKACFGGGLKIMTYADAPEDACSPGGDESGPAPAPDQVMHGMLENGSFLLMASDDPFNKTAVGDNVQININCDSVEHHQQLFDRLSEGGEAVVAPHDAFWGARFAMVVDKFGIHWMLSFAEGK